MTQTLFLPAGEAEIYQRRLLLGNKEFFSDELVGDWYPLIEKVADYYAYSENRNFLLSPGVMRRLAEFLEEVTMDYVHRIRNGLIDPGNKILRNDLLEKTASLAEGFVFSKHLYSGESFFGSRFKILRGEPFPDFITLECSVKRTEIHYVYHTLEGMRQFGYICINKGQDPKSQDHSRIESDMRLEDFWLI